MNSGLLLCVKMKKGLCKNGIYYYMYYTSCVPFPLLYPLCEISNPYFNAPQCEELTSIMPMKGLQLCFQRKWLQLHFTGKSIFLYFKYFSCDNTYRSSSYIVRKTPVTDYREGNPYNTQIWAVLNMQILRNFEAEHESNCQATDMIKQQYSRLFPSL